MAEKINLKNLTIKKLEDRNFNTYFLIINNDNNDEAYFCLCILCSLTGEL